MDATAADAAAAAAAAAAAVAGERAISLRLPAVNNAVGEWFRIIHTRLSVSYPTSEKGMFKLRAFNSFAVINHNASRRLDVIIMTILISSFINIYLFLLTLILSHVSRLFAHMFEWSFQ